MSERERRIKRFKEGKNWELSDWHKTESVGEHRDLLVFDKTGKVVKKVKPKK